MTYEGAEESSFVTTFTIPELALALGKAELTIRRWIEADKIPAPYLRETTRNLRVYSLGELQTLVDVLARFGRDFSYLSAADSTALARLHETMHAYRVHSI